MAQRFNFENAAFHFTKTEGPGGFVWKFLAAYTVLYLVLTGINYGLAAAFFGSMQDLQTQIMVGGFPTGMLGQILAYYAVVTLLGVVFWVLFEASILRRYVRDEGFSLKLGGDEGRLLIVGILWVLLFFASYIAFALFVAAFAMIGGMIDPILGGILSILAVLVGFAVWIYLFVRLSAAGALTVRDRQIRFPSSMKVTKGRFWTLFGAYFILMLILVAFYVVGAVLLFSVVFASSDIDFTNPQSLALAMASLESPVVLIVLSAIGSFLKGLFMFAWAGPAALAAKVDPRLGGGPDAASVFE